MTWPLISLSPFAKWVTTQAQNRPLLTLQLGILVLFHAERAWSSNFSLVHTSKQVAGRISILVIKYPHTKQECFLERNKGQYFLSWKLQAQSHTQMIICKWNRVCPREFHKQTPWQNELHRAQWVERKACITEEENLITMIHLGDSGVIMHGNLGLITLRVYHEKKNKTVCTVTTMIEQRWPMWHLQYRHATFGSTWYCVMCWNEFLTKTWLH